MYIKEEAILKIVARKLAKMNFIKSIGGKKVIHDILDLTTSVSLCACMLNQRFRIM